MEQLNKNSSVAHRYAELEAHRETYLTRARASAKLTIPMLVPEKGHSADTVFDTPFQSVGARGVNNLASKLLLALLPPNSPFFRLTIDDATMAALGQEKVGAVEAGLAQLERQAMSELETSAARVPVYEALRNLIVTGNALMYIPKDGNIRVFRLDRFVVKRDAMGNVLEVITKETVSPRSLPQTHLDVLQEKGEGLDKSYDLYTRCCLKEGRWDIYQEVGGEIVESTRGDLPKDKSPFIPLRFIRIDGEDYGRGYVEEFYGDLSSLEALTRAIVEGSAASSKVLFMVRPNGTTKVSALAKADNGAFIQGTAEDVNVLQMNKVGDFRVTQQTAAEITDRLAFAFLLNSSVQRDAERVTAEEVRFMAQELESALGGVYSILSQELQMPMIKLIMNRLESQGKLPKLPKDTLKPSIITGLEALGRGQDLNKLATFLKFLQPLGADVLAKEMNIDDYIDRLGASLGIDTRGLIKSMEQKQMEAQQAAQAQQAQMMQEAISQMAQKATPAVAKGVVDQQMQPTQ